MTEDRATQIFQNFRSHLKIQGGGGAIGSKLHTQNPQILGAVVPNLAAQTTSSPWSVRP